MRYLDLHCDTISAIRQARREDRPACLRSFTGQVNLERMKQGGCLGQSFALFVNLRKEEDAAGAAKELLALYQSELEENRDRIRPALTADDLLRNDREGRMSAILTLEEGGIFGGDLRVLDAFYRAGARMATLTWNYENELGFPNRFDWQTGACRPETERGLKETGFAFVERMEELGMAVDVSHLGDAGFWDVAGAVKKPFAASHSSARLLAPHPRNLTDSMIRALAERGGVIGINFCPAFLRERPEIKNGREVSAVSDIVRHLLYIRKVGGKDCVCLGSDWDGIEGELEIGSPDRLSLLDDALRKAGLSEPEREKIFWKNAWTFFREVWK